jgi:hypothetical protein
MKRFTPLTIAMVLSGCGASPQAEMPARTWKYYFANPAEIAPMQKICLEWSASGAPAMSQPAVITTNCSAAAYANAHLKWQK